ncbi:MAG: N-acetyltransferase [Leptolyngbyaceae cyanobacterium RM2_2_4]|nr:N-acetyltransferase [Leptolyngbyaceae cyanobacterium SM1_4_3]NJN89070.1 N-acetyltransferase [Leptolyngbyaceae cyanobacterium SL_5_14]NJO53229.1 N-acetyltransferase [Leptolyngbyaceae cyanobacterium RM2_2_4]
MRCIIKIRQEIASDVADIRAVTTAAFLNAPHTSHIEHLIVDALRDSGSLTVSLIAEANGQIVGHVAISPVSISDGSQNWYGLGPISVAPEHQGIGIGSQLVKQALASLRDRSASGCVLVGNPEYYSRFGFKVEPSLVLPDIPPEYFQAISFGTQIPSGIVSFHESFNV